MPEDILFDDELVVDPIAREELSAVQGPEALTEDMLRGARFRLVKLGADRRDLDGRPCLALALQAEFQAPPGGRFTDADVEIALIAPDDARFAGVAPSDVMPRTVVEHEVSRGGKITAKPGEVSGEFEVGHTKTFKTYTCHVKGIGIGGTLATWRLEEDPDTRAGFGANNPLFVTILGEGPFEATVQMRCALRAGGLRGIGEGIVEFILGTALETGKQRRVTFTSPPTPPKSSWIRWL